MEREEERIWVGIRCWHALTLEQAMFLRRLDALRGYTRTPERAYVGAFCWLCIAEMGANETDHWWCQFTAGLTDHGPYCRAHHPRQEK